MERLTHSNRVFPIRGGMIYQTITIIMALVSIILCFIFHPIWGWMPIAIVDFIIGFLLLAAKQNYRFKHIPDLSPEANDLLQHYGHYYAMPANCKDLSGSAVISEYTGVIIAIIGIFKGFWWGIALAIGNWFLVGFIDVSLVPWHWINFPSRKKIHNEICKYIVKNIDTNAKDRNGKGL